MRLMLQSLRRAMSFYAVARGHCVGIYDSWAKCEQQVKGFGGAKYKKFPTRTEAEAFISGATAIAASKPVVTATKRKQQYSPKDMAVALGHGKRMTTTQVVETAARKEPEYFWPSDNEGSVDDNDVLMEAELLAVMAELEAEDDTEQCPTPSIAASGSSRKDKTSSSVSKYHSKVWQAVGTKRIGGHEFAVDEEDFVVVYTDGSCINNGRSNASAGYGVYFDDDHPLNASRPVTGRVTNNVGEIQAAIHAIEVAESTGIRKLCLNTDSQFLINAITSWVNAWKRKGWLLKSGGAVKNAVDFKRLDALLHRSGVEVKWNYVKAHKGIKGNEMADRLAREGSAKYKIAKSSQN